MMTLAIHVPDGRPCLVIDQELRHEYRHDKIIGRSAWMLVEFFGHSRRSVPATDVEIVRFKPKDGNEHLPSREFRAWQGKRTKQAA